MVPMLSSRDDIDVSAYYRTRRETWRELRLRVSKRGEMPPFVSGGGTPVHRHTGGGRSGGRHSHMQRQGHRSGSRMQSRPVNAFASPALTPSSTLLGSTPGSTPGHTPGRTQRSESEQVVGSGGGSGGGSGLGNPFGVTSVSVCRTVFSWRHFLICFDFLDLFFFSPEQR